MAIKGKIAGKERAIVSGVVLMKFTDGITRQVLLTKDEFSTICSLILQMHDGAIKVIEEKIETITIADKL